MGVGITSLLDDNRGTSVGIQGERTAAVPLQYNSILITKKGAVVVVPVHLGFYLFVYIIPIFQYLDTGCSFCCVDP